MLNGGKMVEGSVDMADQITIIRTALGVLLLGTVYTRVARYRPKMVLSWHFEKSLLIKG